MSLSHSDGHRFIGIVGILALLGTAPQVAQLGDVQLQSSRYSVAAMPLSDVQRAVDALGPNVPDEFLARGAAALDGRWSRWLGQHEARLRQRLDRGDEDSVVNLWMFGTSFSRLPPARARDVQQDGRYSFEQVLAERLDELLRALSSSRADERLAFVREVLSKREIDVSTRQGQEAARRLLTSARARARDEFAQTDAALASVSLRGDPKAELATASTIFKDRGLSSDTSLLVGVAIDTALNALRASGTLRSLSVRRVAIVGPGLDFINKADGHDFYPQQTLQPFAVIDSLLRHGLAVVRDLEVTTIDVSSRVHQHLARAHQRALKGESYILHLPLPRNERWSPQIRDLWMDTGTRIGESTRPLHVPDYDNAEIRAISIRPAVVSTITPVQADIVTSRLVVPSDRLFDLVVATNVFVYYSPFEQALAATNVASLLASGGVLLSNNDLTMLPPMKSTVGYLAVRYSDRQNDHIFSYQRE